MAVAQGYGKTVTSGSVFAFDTGDTRNSYIGQPTENLALFGMGASFNTDYPSAVTFSDDPGKGYRGGTAKKAVSTSGWNMYKYPRSGNYTATSSTQFVFSFKIKWEDGRTPVFNNGYIYTDASNTFPGVLVIPLGDGWFQCYCTYGSTSSPVWLTGFSISQTGTCWISDWQVEASKQYPTPYVGAGGTRSATQGLLPLVGTPTINLSNVSFDSNAQITFDGTDDYISAGDTSVTDFGTGNFTVECIVKIDNSIPVDNGYYKGIVTKKGAGGADAGFGIYFNTGYGKFLWSTANGSSNSEIFTTNTWNSLKGSYAHVVMVRQSGATNNGHFYINGIYESISSAATVLNVNNDYNLTIGASSTLYSVYYFLGQIPVTKIYNRALSTGEVRQNYLHYKTRFNLS
jgi:hypothetical protein